MFSWLLELLKMPETKHIKNTEDIDDVQTTVLHRNIIKKRVFFTNCFWRIMEYSKKISKMFLMV